MDMSTSNEDLRIRLAEVDAKVTYIQSSVNDLKQATLGITSLAGEMANLRNDIKSQDGAIGRVKKIAEDACEMTTEHITETQQKRELIYERIDRLAREHDERIEKLARWKAWLTGGITVIAGIAVWTVLKVVDASEKNAVQDQQLSSLNRQVGIVDPILDKNVEKRNK